MQLRISLSLFFIAFNILLLVASPIMATVTSRTSTTNLTRNSTSSIQFTAKSTKLSNNPSDKITSSTNSKPAQINSTSSTNSTKLATTLTLNSTTTTPLSTILFRNSPPLMECEYRDSSVFFKFPNLIEKLNKWMDEAKQSVSINQTETTVETMNNYYMELKHAERIIPKRFQIYPRTVVGENRVMLEKEMAKSKIYFPFQLRFRIVVVSTVQQNQQQQQQQNQQRQQQQQHEYIIQDFKYKSRERLSKRQPIHSWSTDWQLATNEDCFNFTTPYQVRMECDTLEIMYCARQQLTQAFPPDIKVDGTKNFELSDNLWYSKHCIRLDRDCHKCKFLVPYQINGRGENKQQHVGERTRKVCVADTQTRGAPLTWKCEHLLNQCRTNTNTGPVDSRPCTECAAMAAVIGFLLFVILCGVSFACYYKRRRQNKPHKSRQMASTKNNNGHIADKSDSELIEPLYQEIEKKPIKTNQQEIPAYRDGKPYDRPYNENGQVATSL